MVAERLDPQTGWRLIVLASMSNLVFKFALVVTLASRPMAGRLGGLVTLSIVVGTALLFFWS